jgi:predicted nucleic acid-binding protein
MSVEFCDTNVIVYAYDSSAGAKRLQAKALLERLWASGDGAVSVQVLQELYVTLTRKVASPLSTTDARAIVEGLTTWKVAEPTRQEVLEAIDCAGRWQTSFWDAMILVAANKARASVVWSEDLNNGQTYDDTTVRSPFAPPPEA